MADLTPITREETLLAAAAGEDVTVPNPISREELFLAKLAGMEVETPNPISRKELFLQKAINNMGNGGEGLTLDDFVQENLFNGDVVVNEATQVRPSAFYGNNDMTSFKSNSVKMIYNSFAQCKNLVSVDVPNADFDSLSSAAAFDQCTSLKNVNIPAATKTANYMFRGCTALEEITLPSVTALGNNMFLQCSKLKLVDCVASKIGSDTFKFSALETLILRCNTLVPLPYTGLFNGTKFEAGSTGGTVYCPAALIEQYQQATNWSTLYAQGTCNFVAIEGSEYE